LDLRKVSGSAPPVPTGASWARRVHRAILTGYRGASQRGWGVGAYQGGANNFRGLSRWANQRFRLRPKHLWPAEGARSLKPNFVRGRALVSTGQDYIRVESRIGGLLDLEQNGRRPGRAAVSARDGFPSVRDQHHSIHGELVCTLFFPVLGATGKQKKGEFAMRKPGDFIQIPAGAGPAGKKTWCAAGPGKNLAALFRPLNHGGVSPPSNFIQPGFLERATGSTKAILPFSGPNLGSIVMDFRFKFPAYIGIKTPRHGYTISNRGGRKKSILTMLSALTLGTGQKLNCRTGRGF